MKSQYSSGGIETLCKLAKNAASGDDEKIRHSAFVRNLSVIRSRDGYPTQAQVLRQVLLALIDNKEEDIVELNYPDNVHVLIRKEFQRIKNIVSDPDDSYFDLDKYTTRCDIRILCFGRIPVGIEHMESSGLPRSLSYRGGTAQCFNFLRMLKRTLGVTPFYQIHIANNVKPASFLFVYNRDAQEHLYCTIADCLLMNPQFRGLIASSWLYDPHLIDVSPHLTFLRELMENNGAYVFRYGSTSGSLDDALVNSPARQKLYENGKYKPTSYCVVWPRDALIAWAKNRKSHTN